MLARSKLLLNIKRARDRFAALSWRGGTGKRDVSEPWSGQPGQPPSHVQPSWSIPTRTWRGFVVASLLLLVHKMRHGSSNSQSIWRLYKLGSTTAKPRVHAEGWCGVDLSPLKHWGSALYWILPCWKSTVPPWSTAFVKQWARAGDIMK